MTQRCSPCSPRHLDTHCPAPMGCALMWEPLPPPRRGPSEPMPKREQLRDWAAAAAYADALIAKQGDHR